jgi:hypothetical protein
MEKIHRLEEASGRRLPRALVPLACVLIVAALGLGCAGSPGTKEGSGPSGDVYYTRFTMQVDRGFVRSTNYRGRGGGYTLPINTRVEYEGRRRHRYTMRIDGDRTFTFEHVAKHTMDSPQEAFDSFFSPQPIDLSSYSAAERQAIEAGTIEVGMGRYAVLAAAGPPPAVGTLSLDAPIWKYWTNRFVTFTVHFGDDGKVTRIDR